jgi:hypothetical protein
LPLGPHASAISAPNIAAITASEAATLIAHQPLTRGTGDIGHCQRDLLGQTGQRGNVSRASEANSRYGLH